MSPWIAMACRNVWRNRRRSIFLAGTVATGAMALLLFIAYIAATAEGLKEGIIRGGTGHAQIAKTAQFDGFEEQPLQHGFSPQERAQLVAQLKRDDRVRRVVARLSFGGLISNGQRTLTFQGTGTQPDKESQAFGAFQHIESGLPLIATPHKLYNAVMGKEMARRLGVKPGDSVTIMTSTVHGAINAIDLDVGGIVSTGNPESDLYYLQMPLQAAQELLRTEKISRLTVLLEDTEDTAQFQSEMQSKLQGGAQIKTWRQLVPMFEQVLQLYRNQFIVLGFIITLLVFLGVAAMTLTNIFERSREIGTMRAIGISAARIRYSFICEALLQGAIGVFAGYVIAALGSWLVNSIGVYLPPPPGRNVGVPLRLLWVPEYAGAIMLLLPVTAMLAAHCISRKISSLPVVQSLNEQH